MKRRWNPNKKEYIETPHIDKFIAEILSVCEKYKLGLSTGDYIYSLEIVNYDPELVKKVFDLATDSTTEPTL